MDQKILLLVAALALLFLPQLMLLLSAIKAKLLALLPVTKPVNPAYDTVEVPNPAEWVNDLFALQQILLANDRKDAADLVGQAIVKLVNTSATRTGGSRR